MTSRECAVGVLQRRVPHRVVGGVLGEFQAQGVVDGLGQDVVGEPVCTGVGHGIEEGGA